VNNNGASFGFQPSELQLPINIEFTRVVPPPRNTKFYRLSSLDGETGVELCFLVDWYELVEFVRPVRFARFQLNGVYYELSRKIPARVLYRQFSPRSSIGNFVEVSFHFSYLKRLFAVLKFVVVLHARYFRLDDGYGHPEHGTVLNTVRVVSNYLRVVASFGQSPCVYLNLHGSCHVDHFIVAWYSEPRLTAAQIEVHWKSNLLVVWSGFVPLWINCDVEELRRISIVARSQVDSVFSGTAWNFVVEQIVNSVFPPTHQIETLVNL